MESRLKELEISVINKVKELDFSGVVFFQNNQGPVIATASGYSNRSEEILNVVNTRFGIASGCKLFTAIGICQLVEKEKLTFESKLADLLDHKFPHFHPDITIHQLLTHTSGIPDYFDEDIMDDFEELWVEKPMYKMTNLESFLPFFQHLPMKYEPGEKFHYNNAGYILLGLIIEKVAEVPFSQYVEENVFSPAQMVDSGYFSLDRLPAKTAIGYVDEENGSWRTNQYSIPVKGGSDGGAYITAPDMCKLWDALNAGKLVSLEMVEKMKTDWVHVEDDQEFYGYGLWIEKDTNQVVTKYHVMGYDPGVSFASGYYPQSNSVVVIPSNQESGPHKLMFEIEKHM
ncbi:serine hydrolase domain-containing protein [Sutcliffiella rhizosphaerae]|uniref:Penicillin-binding protein PbpX n=1 Tax=Sutcliffiella rhizosphaerae TaxID=2880967 RepID=A0ABN8AC86_9BACI|nr:serine hydrolase domain-containing protein [Sutcliffiella rhizosphaerae]CAG9621561.1 Putative penicillin-binding protein PbpX [Sutcliffiella rhizosphaerae]